MPNDITINPVGEQARYVRQSLNNAMQAAGGGALLAMLTVYLFLGDLRRTLVIGSAIPVAILVTFILMAAGELTLNIMTLGGLALGVGMLVDSAIVMLENIQRHQQQGDPEAATHGAAEVNSAIVAATSTNLAAVIPFLFIGGLVGLLFRELIFTVSAAIVGSMLIALTLTPALAGRIGDSQNRNPVRRGVDALMELLQRGYGYGLSYFIHHPWPIILLFISGLLAALPLFDDAKQIFLPNMDEGRIYVRLHADRGINLDKMDRLSRKVEKVISDQPETEMVFTIVGGRVFGRSQYEATNRTSIQVRLKPLSQRGGISSNDWIRRVKKQINNLGLAGVKVTLRSRGIRGIRLSHGDDDISLRLQGPDLDKLEKLAEQTALRLRQVEGLRNIEHSSEEHTLELAVKIDRERAAQYGLDVDTIGKAVRFALDGSIVTDYLENDRSLDVRLRLDRRDMANPEDLNDIILFSKTDPRTPVRLDELARVELITSPTTILRDQQQRMVEISASLNKEKPLGEVLQQLKGFIDETELPPDYTLYEAGSLEALKEGRQMGQLLLGLALFLVFTVMAVQYESLRNPLVIILGVPFAVTGVAAGLLISGLPLSMPVWLGLIMLAGIVVNNAIVLVEYIEIQRRKGLEKMEAIIEAAKLRLRPILMATLTTVVGMLPLALALGEGAEMLQPLAVTIVSGLSFSLLVSLLLIPVLYRLLGKK